MFRVLPHRHSSRRQAYIPRESSGLAQKLCSISRRADTFDLNEGGAEAPPSSLPHQASLFSVRLNHYDYNKE